MDRDSTLRDVCVALQSHDVVAFARRTARIGYRQFFPESIHAVEAMVDQAYDRLADSQRAGVDPRGLTRVTGQLLEQVFHRGERDFWWNRTYHQYKTALKPETDLRFLAPLIQGSRVLDFGCGSGYLAARLARDGYRVFTTDVLDYRLEEARALPFVRMASATELGYPDDSIDSALVQAVLHHIDARDLAAVLRGLARVARRVIIKEDVWGVSAEMPELSPDVHGQELFRAYAALPPAAQFQAMVLMDFYSNAIAQGITDMNMPFAFRTIADWQSTLTSNGFRVTETRVTGFEPARMHTSCYAWFVCDRES